MIDTFHWLDENSDRSPKTYIVLGCHRSGTTFITQALKNTGVVLQGLSSRCEDSRFVRLNSEILQAAGGRWNCPPSRGKLLEAVAKHEAETRGLLVSASENQLAWAWKDPQQVLTAEGMVPIWLDMLDDVYLICIFRRPEKVEQSMKRVYGEENTGLAREYAKRTIATIETFMGLV
jgi:hypothetical protein